MILNEKYNKLWIDTCSLKKNKDNIQDLIDVFEFSNCKFSECLDYNSLDSLSLKINIIGIYNFKIIVDEYSQSLLLKIQRNGNKELYRPYVENGKKIVFKNIDCWYECLSFLSSLSEEYLN